MQLVIGLNLAIALFGFYLTWRIWRVRRVLRSATVVLTLWERNAVLALKTEAAPTAIYRGQQTVTTARAQYARLEQALQQLRQLCAIASAGMWLLRRVHRRR
jgi:hypothetical protein